MNPERRLTIAQAKALGSETRLEILDMLRESGRAGLTPTEIGRRLGITQSTSSRHLKQLYHAGLVWRRRPPHNPQEVRYSLTKGDSPRALLNYIERLRE